MSIRRRFFFLRISSACWRSFSAIFSGVLFHRVFAASEKCVLPCRFKVVLPPCLPSLLATSFMLDRQLRRGLRPGFLGRLM